MSTWQKPLPSPKLLFTFVYTSRRLAVSGNALVHSAVRACPTRKNETALKGLNGDHCLAKMLTIWEILSSKPEKRTTISPIPTWIIRDAKNELLPTVTDIINASLRSSEVPTSMKSAVVTPLINKAALDPEILKKLPPC